jgi:hypothetical protein
MVMFGSRHRRDVDAAAPYFDDDRPLTFKGVPSFQQHKFATVASQDRAMSTDWDDLLGLIKHTGKTIQATEQRALKIASHAENVAREAVNELQRAKQAAETARANEQSALQAAETAKANEQSALDRAERAEDLALEAELRAREAENKASELETMFAQVRDALWADIIAPHASAPQMKAAA